LIDYLIDSRHSPWPGRQSHTAHLLLVVPSSESHWVWSNDQVDVITVHNPFRIVVPSTVSTTNHHLRGIIAVLPRYYRVTVWSVVHGGGGREESAKRTEGRGVEVFKQYTLDSSRWALELDRTSSIERTDPRGSDSDRTTTVTIEMFLNKIKLFINIIQRRQ